MPTTSGFNQARSRRRPPGRSRRQVAPPPPDVSAVLDATVRDESPMRTLQAQFCEAQKLAVLGRLASGIVHDFNNQITIILGFADLALAKIAPDHPAHNNLDRIRKAAERSAALTTRLLGFSRKHAPQPVATDLNALLSDLTKSLGRLLDEDVHLAFVPTPGLGLAAVDRSLLEQAVINLIINARDAMPSGGRIDLATANVEVSPDGRTPAGPPPGSYVRLSIADTGAGMDGDTQKHIFDPFFTTKAEGKGTGLGLTMVSLFMEQAGGHIGMESQVGRGTRFHLHFPRVAAPAPAPEPAEARPPTPGSGTVLLVEDDDDLRHLTGSLLKDCGYGVLEAATGGEAMTLARRRYPRIDLVVSDVVMPDMSGPNLVRQVRGVRGPTPALYVSGHAEATLRGRGLVDGQDPLLAKPFNRQSLGDKVREILDATRS